MDKNTIIAIVLSAIVFIAGFTLQNVFFPQTPAPSPAQTTAQNDSSSDAPQKTITSPQSGITAIAQTDTLTEERPVLETPLVRVEFTNRGGDVLSYRVKEKSGKEGYVEMAEGVTTTNRAFSLILGDATVTPVDQLFNVKRISDTQIGFFQTFQTENKEGSKSTFTLGKLYTFYPDDYMFDLQVSIDGDASLSGLRFDQVAYTIKTAPQIGPTWNRSQDKYEYRNFYHLLNDKKKKITLGDNQTKKIADTVSWAGIAGKYFAIIAYPESGIKGVTYSTVGSTSTNSVAQMYLSRAPITANKNMDVWHFYVGPKTEKELGKYSVTTKNQFNMSNTKLDQIIDGSGILGPLEILLKKIMEFLYMLVPNWGVSIIIMTVLMRAAIFPLTKKSMRATSKMQELQPQIQEIQEKYKNNQQKMNEEMAKFYQTVGYNPLSGCLPVLIQFPLIFAMYNLFNNYFEFRGAMFIPGWIPDLSRGDVFLAFPFTVPFLGWSDLRLLPIIYVISQLFYGKVTQTPGSSAQNGTMKFMMYGMPLLFFFMFYNAPSGLLIYWIFSNMLTLVQQVVINRMIKAEKKAEPKPNLKLVKKRK